MPFIGADVPHKNISFSKCSFLPFIGAGVPHKIPSGGDNGGVRSNGGFRVATFV